MDTFLIIVLIVSIISTLNCEEANTDKFENDEADVVFRKKRSTKQAYYYAGSKSASTLLGNPSSHSQLSQTLQSHQSTLHPDVASLNPFITHKAGYPASQSWSYSQQKQSQQNLPFYEKSQFIPVQENSQFPQNLQYQEYLTNQQYPSHQQSSQFQQYSPYNRYLPYQEHSSYQQYPYYQQKYSTLQSYSPVQSYTSVKSYSPGQWYLPGQWYSPGQSYSKGQSYSLGQSYSPLQSYSSSQSYSSQNPNQNFLKDASSRSTHEDDPDVLDPMLTATENYFKPNSKCNSPSSCLWSNSNFGLKGSPYAPFVSKMLQYLETAPLKESLKISMQLFRPVLVSLVQGFEVMYPHLKDEFISIIQTERPLLESIIWFIDRHSKSNPEGSFTSLYSGPTTTSIYKPRIPPILFSTSGSNYKYNNAPENEPAENLLYNKYTQNIKDMPSTLDINDGNIVTADSWKSYGLFPPGLSQGTKDYSKSSKNYQYNTQNTQKYSESTKNLPQNTKAESETPKIKNIKTDNKDASKKPKKPSDDYTSFENLDQQHLMDPAFGHQIHQKSTLVPQMLTWDMSPAYVASQGAIRGASQGAFNQAYQGAFNRASQGASNGASWVTSNAAYQTLPQKSFAIQYPSSILGTVVPRVPQGGINSPIKYAGTVVPWNNPADNRVAGYKVNHLFGSTFQTNGQPVYQFNDELDYASEDDSINEENVEAENGSRDEPNDELDELYRATRDVDSVSDTPSQRDGFTMVGGGLSQHSEQKNSEHTQTYYNPLTGRMEVKTIVDKSKTDRTKIHPESKITFW